MYLFLLRYKFKDINGKVDYGEQWVRVKRLAFEEYQEGNYKPDSEAYGYLKGRLNYKRDYDVLQITIKRRVIN